MELSHVWTLWGMLEAHPDKDGRLDLKLRLWGGKVYLHRLCWWMRTGRKSATWRGDWAKFARENRCVDHGSGGHAFSTDFRKLGLQTASKSASQGRGLAQVYAASGGLGVVQRASKVLKRPSSLTGVEAY